jgi:hypothetical protein
MRLDPRLVEHEINVLLAKCPELADDEDLRRDMIEGSTSAFEVLTALVRRILETEAHVEGLGTCIASLAQRRTRLDTRAKALRAATLRIAKAVQADMPKRKAIELAIATLSIRDGKPKLVVDDEQVPDPLCTPVTTYVPDLERIREELELGADVTWAEILPATPSLTIRVK